jgi:glutathione transport system permease protein
MTLQWRRRGPGVAGLLAALAIGAGVVLAPWVAPTDPNAPSLQRALEPPRWTSPFGHDELGRDVLSRVLYGGRASVLIGVGAVLLGFALGGLAGALAGYRGGWADALIMRGAEVPQVFSGVILAVWAMAILGPGIPNIIVALALRSVPLFARLGRNITLTVRQQTFVEAAEALGAGSGRILACHVLPALLAPLVAVAILRVGSTILTGAALSFLGLGVPPEVPEWGVMVKNGMSYVRMGAYHLVLFPGLAIMLTVLAMNLVGEGVQDRWAPRRNAGWDGRPTARADA